MEELIRYMRGLLALQARLAAESNPEMKVDVLLARMGLPHKEIAHMLGRSPAAVAKAVSRNK